MGRPGKSTVKPKSRDEMIKDAESSDVTHVLQEYSDGTLLTKLFPQAPPEASTPPDSTPPASTAQASTGRVSAHFDDSMEA